MGESFLNKLGCSRMPEINNFIIYKYPVASGQTIKAGDFVTIENDTVKLATTKGWGIAKESGTGGKTISVFLNAFMGGYTNFKDTSLFNINQNATIALVNEATPVSSSFIRLSKNASYEYPAVGFTLSNKTQLHTTLNVVACILYKFTSSGRNPRAGWASATDGSSVWNCWANSDTNLTGSGKGWKIARIKLGKSNWNNLKTKGAFGFCQQWREDNIVLDIAGIWFYRLTDEHYGNPHIINNLGPIM